MSPGAFIRALPAPPQAHPGRPDTPCAASPAYPPPSQPTENSIAGCADPPRQSNRAFASASDAKTLNSFSQLAGNLASETSSLKTASSTGESCANLTSSIRAPKKTPSNFWGVSTFGRLLSTCRLGLLCFAPRHSSQLAKAELLPVYGVFLLVPAIPCASWRFAITLARDRLG
jgi:hypothetical protein